MRIREAGFYFIPRRDNFDFFGIIVRNLEISLFNKMIVVKSTCCCFTVIK